MSLPSVHFLIPVSIHLYVCIALSPSASPSSWYPFLIIALRGSRNILKSLTGPRLAPYVPPLSPLPLATVSQPSGVSTARAASGDSARTWPLLRPRCRHRSQAGQGTSTDPSTSYGHCFLSSRPHLPVAFPRPF